MSSGLPISDDAIGVPVSVFSVNGPVCRFRTVLLVAALCSYAAAQSADEALARGARLQREGDLEGAVAAFREAVEAAPSRIDALSSLSVAYLAIGRPSEAVPGLRKAREAVPQHPGVAYFLGLAYFQTGQYREARDELEWVVRNQPANQQAIHLHGLCLLKLGDLQAGIAALEEVVRADPSNRQAACTLGSAYIKAGLVDRAEDLVSQRLRDDETPEALLIKGSVRLARKDYEQALAIFDRARLGAAKLPMLHSQTGVALLYAGRRERAAEEFQAELDINPLDFNANAFLGWLLQQDGESERALALLQAAYAQNESDTGVQYLLAQVQSSRGEWHQVEALLESVVQAQPAFIPAHVMLARAYAKLRRTDRFRQQREIIDKLNAQQQERDLRGVDQLYDGTVLSMPRR